MQGAERLSVDVDLHHEILKSVRSEMLMHDHEHVVPLAGLVYHLAADPEARGSRPWPPMMAPASGVNGFCSRVVSMGRAEALSSSEKLESFGQCPAQLGSELGPLGEQLEIGELKARSDGATHQGVRAKGPGGLPPAGRHAVEGCLLVGGGGAEAAPLQAPLVGPHLQQLQRSALDILPDLV